MGQGINLGGSVLTQGIRNNLELQCPWKTPVSEARPQLGTAGKWWNLHKVEPNVRPLDPWDDLEVDLGTSAVSHPIILLPVHELKNLPYQGSCHNVWSHHRPKKLPAGS